MTIKKPEDLSLQEIRFLLVIKYNQVYCKIMANKLTPKVILEGTRLTFKTEIAFELNEHPRVVGPRKFRPKVQ